MIRRLRAAKDRSGHFASVAGPATFDLCLVCFSFYCDNPQLLWPRRPSSAVHPRPRPPRPRSPVHGCRCTRVPPRWCGRRSSTTAAVAAAVAAAASMGSRRGSPLRVARTSGLPAIAAARRPESAFFSTSASISGLVVPTTRSMRLGWSGWRSPASNQHRSSRVFGAGRMGGFSGQTISQAPDQAGPKVLAVVVTLHTPAVAA